MGTQVSAVGGRTIFFSYDFVEIHIFAIHMSHCQATGQPSTLLCLKSLVLMF